MKKFFTIAAVMLFAATTMWAETTIYDFTGKTADSSPTISSTSHHKAGNSKNVYVVTEGEGKDKFCFQEVGPSNGFFYSTINLSQTKGDRYFSIIDLKAGDKITISYSSTAAGSSSGDFTIANSGTSSSTNLSLSLGGTAIEAGTNVVSGTAYYVLADGYVDFLTKKNFYMTQVTIDPFDPSAKVALSGAWTPASAGFHKDSEATLPTFAVTGGEAVLGTDYTVTYSVVSAENNIVTVNSSTGITAINTSVEDTVVVRATVAIVNTESYTITTTTYDCEVSVYVPTCAAPVITFNGYNYEQGKYEFVATCATEGATLQFRKQGEDAYAACTDGESFFVEGTGNSNDKVIVKATKKDYNEKATTTAYYLNAAPAATSPETLIPFLLGNDDSFKNHAYAYRSVTIGEENNASSIGGTNGANMLKIRTNQSGNTLSLYVHEGYKVTNVTITGKTNSTGAEKVVKVASLAVDGAEVSAWTGKDVVFPVSSAEEAVACSTGAISAASTIKFTFAAGGTGSMHSQIIASIVVTYEKDSPTAVDNIETSAKAVKFIENGQVVILREGVKYNVQGQIIR